jgi:hypothetical protein
MQALADMQRAIDQMQQQQALQTQALLNTIRGRWDAAQFGVQSVESMLVALDPALHGKVAAIPFTTPDETRSPVTTGPLVMAG